MVILKSLLAGIVVLLVAISVINQELDKAHEHSADQQQPQIEAKETPLTQAISVNVQLPQFEGNETQPIPAINAEIIEAAKRIGLEGKWIVVNIEKDGPFSQAKIGQQPNDVISIIPGADTNGSLIFG